MQKYRIAFVGTGMIGGGLAVNAMLAGQSVILYDVAPVETVKANIKKILDIMVEAGATDADAAEMALSQAEFTNDLAEAAKNADFVQECIPERTELKKTTYRTIQEVAGVHAVIASSTSTFFPTQLQEGAIYPDRILVGHPYNPSYLLPLMEICGGEETSEEAKEIAKDVYTAMKKVPIICKKESNGFIVNRVSWAARDMAQKIVVDEGVCSVEDMDKAIIFGPGMRMAVTGQLLTMSLGVDGGYREYEKKYAGATEASEPFLKLAEGVDEYLEHRTSEEGNTVEDVIKYRDKMFVTILKAHGLI